MKKGYKATKIELFKTQEGLPTCSSGHGKDCRFLTQDFLGLRFICSYKKKPVERYSAMGFLKPDQNCPLWSSENENP
jgi:hypothetical protein